MCGRSRESPAFLLARASRSGARLISQDFFGPFAGALRWGGQLESLIDFGGGEMEVGLTAEQRFAGLDVAERFVPFAEPDENAEPRFSGYEPLRRSC